MDVDAFNDVVVKFYLALAEDQLEAALLHVKSLGVEVGSVGIGRSDSLRRPARGVGRAAPTTPTAAPAEDPRAEVQPRAIDCHLVLPSRVRVRPGGAALPLAPWSCGASLLTAVACLCLVVRCR
jgi:hypothetical protein